MTELSADMVSRVLIAERMPLTAYIAGITCNYHLAEDVYQDVCVKAISRPETFESTTHVIQWAKLAGRNRAIDLLRIKGGKYQVLDESLLAELSAIWPEAQDGSLRNRMNVLRECLTKLPPSKAELIRMRYFDGCSGTEIAARLGRRVDAIYQAISRVHKTLGRCVDSQMKSAG